MDNSHHDYARNYLLAESYRKLGDIEAALKHYECCIDRYYTFGNFGDSYVWGGEEHLIHNAKTFLSYCNYVLENKITSRYDFIKKLLFDFLEYAQGEESSNRDLGKNHFLLGNLYYLLRNFKQSEEEIKKAEFFGFGEEEVVSLKKKLASLGRVDGLLAKAKEEKSQKGYEKAIKYCEEILKIDENNPSALNLLGLVYTEIGVSLLEKDSIKAEEFFTKAIKLDNTGMVSLEIAQAYLCQAQNYEAKGLYQQAIEYYKKAGLPETKPRIFWAWLKKQLHNPIKALTGLADYLRKYSHFIISFIFKYFIFIILFVWWLLTTVLYFIQNIHYLYDDHLFTEWKQINKDPNWVFAFALLPIILLDISPKPVLITVNFMSRFWWLLIVFYFFVLFIRNPSHLKQNLENILSLLAYMIFQIVVVWLELNILFITFFSNYKIIDPYNEGGKFFTLGLLVCTTSQSLFYTVGKLIPNDIPKIWDWFLVEFFNIFSKKRRQEIKALRAAKKQEKGESEKIQKDLKKKNKEAKRLEKENIPKIPIKLDNEQIKSDISYLKTLPDKGHLIKYSGNFVDRFIAKGQAKTYQEIKKVIIAKTEVENALEGLAVAQEGRYTAQERAQAKYLLETLQDQAAIRKHYNQESLEDLRLEIEREKLEAEREEARKRKEIAKKETADLHTPQPQQPQPKTEMDRFRDELGREVNKNKKMDMVDIELNKRIKALEERAKQEGWSFERFETERDLEIARFQQFAQKNIK
ncbi:MAG: MalT-like region [Campylobacterota bacterium]|nr:MalT-like region [Campylobacterota bacterium]